MAPRRDLDPLEADPERQRRTSRCSRGRERQQREAGQAHPAEQRKDPRGGAPSVAGCRVIVEAAHAYSPATRLGAHRGEGSALAGTTETWTLRDEPRPRSPVPPAVALQAMIVGYLDQHEQLLCTACWPLHVEAGSKPCRILDSEEPDDPGDNFWIVDPCADCG